MFWDTESQVAGNPSLENFAIASKETCSNWLKRLLGWTWRNSEEVIAVCGRTNALNKMIHFSHELPDLQLLYLNEPNEDPFNETSDKSDSDDSH